MSIDEAKQLLSAAGVCYPEDEEMPGLHLNMNDTWGWALAWGEPVPDDKVVEVATLFSYYGTCGLLYWVSEQHNQMRSEFADINRFVDFVRNEERVRKETPDSSERAYRKITYKIGEKESGT